MDHFDEQLKQRARQEPFQTPPSYLSLIHI